jgi:hypothetical protein
MFLKVIPPIDYQWQVIDYMMLLKAEVDWYNYHYLAEFSLLENGPIRHVETCPDFFFHCKSAHNKIHCQNFSC